MVNLVHARLLYVQHGVHVDSDKAKPWAWFCLQ